MINEAEPLTPVVPDTAKADPAQIKPPTEDNATHVG